MYEVHTRLFIGNDEDYDKVADKAGWSFLRPVKYGSGGHQDILKYKTMGAPDGPNKYIAEKGKNHLALNILDLDDPHFMPWDETLKAFDFVKKRLEAGDKVLIACNQGHSRGPTLALMFLRSIGDMPYHFVKAEHILKTLDPDYSPGQGMRQFARTHWTDLDRLELR